MPTSNEKQYYVELTRHTLHAVRAAGPAIEFYRECALDQKAAVEELLAAWGNGTPVRAIAALTPLQSHWHLSAGNEASRHRTDAALRAFGGGLPHGFDGVLELLSCHAEDGSPVTPVGNARWLINLAPVDVLDAAVSAARERGIEAIRVESSILTRVAAAATAIRHAGSGPVLLWDLGVERSQLFLVTSRGVEAVTGCAAGLDALFTIVQSALGLKLRGAAARLFFNDTYDFSEAGPRIAAELAPALKTAMASLPASTNSAAFACASFTGKQAWFSAEVARAIGFSPWTPDVAKVVSHLQLRLPAGDSVSTDLLGVLHLAGSHSRKLTEWHPTWLKQGAAPAVAATALAPETPAPVKAAPAVVEPVIKAVTVTTTAPRTVPVEATPVIAGGAAAAVALAPAPKSSPAVQAKPVGKPEVKSTAHVEVAPNRKQEKSSGKGGGSTPPKAPANPPAAPAAAAQAAPVPTPAPAPVATTPAAPAKKRGFGLYIGIAAVLGCALFAGKFYLDAKAAQETIEQEKVVAAQLAKAAAARTQALEEQAKAEADRIRREAEQARETAVALARQQAEQQTRQQITAELEAERIAKSPGILIVTTSPVGADVSVDGGPVRQSPLSLNDILPGTHRIRITKENYEPVELTATIAGTKTTDLGLIMLQRATGTLNVTSVPDQIEFTVRKAGVPGAQPIRSGRTPAQLDDLPPGDYSVTFAQPGWKDQVELVAIEKRATANVAAAFNGGAILLTSTPTGATVSRNGAVIGITPLSLSGLAPQKVSYELTLAGHDPVTVAGEIVEGQQTKLETRMLSIDRISGSSEISAPPQAFEMPAPRLTGLGSNLPPEVKMTFYVLRDGSTRDVQVVGDIDRDLARVCIDAVSRWKFHPATNDQGRPLNVRVTLPIKITADML